MKKCLLMLSGIVMTAGMLLAQPGNDNCTEALPMNYAKTEGELVLVTGDTRGGTFDANVPNPCSTTWTADDIWFSVTTPDTLPADGIIVRCYFGTEPDDVPAVGMAFHSACDASTPFACFSSDDPNDDRLEIASACLQPATTYMVRVWSGGSATDFSGTFRIGAYGKVNPDNVLWEETFGDGLAGWMTFGTCDNADSNANAIWRYLPDGLLDMGAYIFQGFGISSPTLCNGAVGVDSDFDDNAGIEGNFGAGRCPAPGQYVLVSPALAHSEWGVAGVSITWTQCIRQFQSTYFVGFRTYKDNVWGDWVSFQINQEHETNGGAITNDVQRLFMGGANEGDSLQIRFVYNANYYMWGIDDIRLIETECTNMRSMPNWYAIAPAVNTPAEQVVPWWPLNDIYNAGACTQDNVNLNCTVRNSGGMEVYNQNLSYGTLPADTLAENVNFAIPVMVPNGKNAIDTYTGVYTVTSDSATEAGDFDFSDNMNQFMYSTTADLFALETGFTRSVAVSNTIYDVGAPLSYTYGNYFYFPQGDGYKLRSVTWGVANPADVAGIPINLILFKWIDANDNEIAESSEREILGFATHTFDGTEADNIILETILESFTGGDILFEDGARYLMMVEYNANDDTFFFLLASEEYDYGGVVLSAAQAGAPTYASVLGFSPDGNVQGIDYEVTELGDPDRVYFGWNIVPLVRLNIDATVGVKDVLPEENLVKLYPSPASEKVKLELEFTQKMEHVQIIMIDVSGKSLFMENYENMDHASLEFNVERLVPGTYTMHISTEKGSRAVPFVVQR